MADVTTIVSQIRRLVHDPLVSSGRANSEYIEYIKDATSQVRLDYPDFTEFTVSGTSITPTPDSIDQTLLAHKSACQVIIDDQVEAIGDAILIRTGKIQLDTSKSNRGFKDVVDSVCNVYNGMIESIIIHGKAGVGLSEGSRIDNFIVDINSIKDASSLL